MTIWNAIQIKMINHVLRQIGVSANGPSVHILKKLEGVIKSKIFRWAYVFVHRVNCIISFSRSILLQLILCTYYYYPLLFVRTSFLVRGCKQGGYHCIREGYCFWLFYFWTKSNSIWLSCQKMRLDFEWRVEGMQGYHTFLMGLAL